MKARVLAVILAALLPSSALGQTPTYVSVTEALSAGVLGVCLRVYVLAAQLRAGAITEDEARRLAAESEGWAPAEALPAGIVPNADEHTIYSSANISGVGASVVAAIGMSPTSTNCSLVALNSPAAAPDAIRAFRSEFRPLSTPSVSADAGIDMFGLRIGDRVPDLGITVYTPLTQGLRELDVGAMVSVGWIPREAIDTGIFDPRRY